jgi:hypothetical protein
MNSLMPRGQGAQLRQLILRSAPRFHGCGGTGNTASAALLHKVDFIQERLHPRYTWIKGEWTDDLLVGMLAPSASQ